jgi:hypothetical protein
MTYYNIYRHKSLKISFLKNEYKYIIMKSLITNKHVKPKIQCLIKNKLILCSKKTRISFQKKVCLILGKHRSIHPKILLKRHTIKKLSATASIPNISPSKW